MMTAAISGGKRGASGEGKERGAPPAAARRGAAMPAPGDSVRYRSRRGRRSDGLVSMASGQAARPPRSARHNRQAQAAQSKSRARTELA